MASFGEVPGAAVPGVAVPGAIVPGDAGPEETPPPVLFAVGASRQLWTARTSRNT